MNGRRDVAWWWHAVTFAVAVFALVLQTYLVAAGQTIIDTDVVTASLPERVRRLFSYFTIQANLAVSVATFLIITARTDSRFFRVVRLASFIGITVTGVVAAVALPPSPGYSTANLVCDRLLHVVVPALSFVGWFVVGPRGFARRADLLPALIWPVVWLVATLGLGPLVDWYPYPFLDAGDIGYARTLVNCLAIAALFLGLSALAVWADGRLPRGRAGEVAPSGRRT